MAIAVRGVRRADGINLTMKSQRHNIGSKMGDEQKPQKGAEKMTQDELQARALKEKVENLKAKLEWIKTLPKEQQGEPERRAKLALQQVEERLKKYA